MGANLDGEEVVVAVLAEKLEESGDIGVALADHIIVADGDFVSLAESGYLERGLPI